MILNIFIAFFALISTIISAKDIANKQSTKKDRIRDWWLIFVAALIMVLTVWNLFIQSSNEKADQIEKKSLHTDIKTIQSKLDIQLKNDNNFESWLKNTYGIERKGDTAIVYNTNIYYSKAPKQNVDGIPDSINYSFKLIKDTLVVFPKEGVWVKPFFSFDQKLFKANGEIYQSDGTEYSIPYDITTVNNKKLHTITVDMSLTRSKERPLVMNISGDKNQYVIFGDEATPSKRYIYEHGKINWIPLK